GVALLQHFFEIEVALRTGRALARLERALVGVAHRDDLRGLAVLLQRLDVVFPDAAAADQREADAAAVDRLVALPARPSPRSVPDRGTHRACRRSAWRASSRGRSRTPCGRWRPGRDRRRRWSAR